MKENTGNGSLKQAKPAPIRAMEAAKCWHFKAFEFSNGSLSYNATLQKLTQFLNENNIQDWKLAVTDQFNIVIVYRI